MPLLKESVDKVAQSEVICSTIGGSHKSENFGYKMENVYTENRKC